MRSGRHVPVSCLRTDFFLSAYYPLFWDNLVRYATGRPVPHACRCRPFRQRRIRRSLVDILGDNLSDIFRPGGVIRLKPTVEGRTNYPYEVAAALKVQTLVPCRQDGSRWPRPAMKSRFHCRIWTGGDIRSGWNCAKASLWWTRHRAVLRCASPAGGR